MPRPPGPDLYRGIVQAQATRNAKEDGDWESFASHRRRLHAALETTPAGGRLCVLGAGNGNDLDLARLTERFAEVHLVDLDAAAVQRALVRQPQEAKRKLVPHAPLDLAGDLLTRLPDWRRKPASTTELNALIAPTVERITQALPGPFDVVLSSCVLSQIFFAAAGPVDPRSAFAESLCQTLALIHLRTVTRLLSPGGHAWLACDMSSSALAPGLELWEDRDEARELVRDLAQQSLHSIGMNPFLLRRRFREDTELAQQAEDPTLGDAWIWRVSPEDLFVVFTLRWRRRA